MTVDSGRTLSGARSAQREFERRRRHQLPYGASWSPAGCRERVGRFCWYDENGDTTDVVPEDPPAESPRIIAERERLLRRLDSAAAIIPGDDWIIGQQVRYLIEAGRTGDAEERARMCAEGRWWCAALAGMALHVRREFGAADSAFAVALAAMPEPERCEWTDLSKLLDGELHDRYRRLSCAERIAVDERVWWLTDPLHARPGNDRRTEHLSRVTLHHAQQRAASAHGLTWGNDLGELTIRYGWATHYTRATPRFGDPEPPSVTGHHRSPGYRFFPIAGALELAGAAEDAWSLRPTAARERYSPTYATFAPLDQQTAVFPRGDSILVAAAYDTGADTLFGQRPIEAALVLSSGPDSARRGGAVEMDAPKRGVIVARGSDVPQLASIEIIGDRRVRRARLAIGTEGLRERRVRLSDVAFFTAGDSLPSHFEEFVERMRPTATARRDERLGLYWELSGTLPEDAPVTTRIEIVRDGRSWLRRAGERIGVLSPDRGVRLGWSESARSTTGVRPRAVVIDLAALDPGSYRIEVIVEPQGEIPQVARRTLRVVR